MPDFIATSPDGRKFKITAPEGATPDEMAEYAEKNIAALPSATGDKKKENPSIMSDIGKGAGSGGVEGAVGLVTGPVDLGARLGAFLANKAGKAIQGDAFEETYPPSLTKYVSKKLGADYDPQTVPGQYAKTIASFGPAVAAMRPDTIGKGIMNAVGSGSLSETAGQVTKGTPIEPYARAAAGILPTGLIPGAQALTKTALRGGASPDEIERNISTFEKSGTTPSVGQATGSNVARNLESLLSKVPGSSDVMNNFAKKQASEIGTGVNKTADTISPASSSAAAGRAIQDDVRNIFKPDVQKTQRHLYDTLDQYIPGSTMVNVNNTEAMLNELTSPIKNAKNLSANKVLSSPGMESIKEDFEKDMAGTPATKSNILDAQGNPLSQTSAGAPRTTMPYEALKDLRTKINAKIQQFNLEPDVNKADLKRLAGALTKDMRAAVEATGGRAGIKAFDKANSYTTQLHADLDQLENIVNKNGGEKVFDAAMEGSNRGDTTIRTVMKALPEKSRALFSAAVLKRLGKANPSNQNDIGDVFSTETFLTNWNKLSPGAKSALFDGYGAGFSNNMDRIAKVANNIREGSKFFKNPSGTAGASNLIEAVSDLGASVLAKIAVHKNMAQAMTDPKFVKWLAEATSSKNSPAATIASIENYLRDPDSGSKKKKPGALAITVKPSDANMPQINLPPIPQTIDMPAAQ